MRHLEKQRPPVRKCYNVAGPSLEICLPIFTSCDNGYDVCQQFLKGVALISQSQAPDQINLKAKNLIDGPMYVYDHSYHLPCVSHAQ